MNNILKNRLHPYYHKHDDACGCGHDHSVHSQEHTHHHDACGCEHDHSEHSQAHTHHHEACGCEHDHSVHSQEHTHHHDACGCGHDHSHSDHEHSHSHTHGQSDDRHIPSEYCDVCGERLADCTCQTPHNGMEKRVYILENLGCAHCASKMEAKIRELPGVDYATITYATKQLRLSAKDHQNILPEIQKICSSIESEVKVVPRDRTLPGSFKTKTYVLENLGCAHCASKMEEEIGRLEGISDATLTFATRQLRITAKDPDRYLSEIRKICTSIEADVQVLQKDTVRKSSDIPHPEAGSASPKGSLSKERKDLISILVGAVLFIIGEILENLGYPSLVTLPIFVVGYLALGSKILFNAARNICKGQIFDENFLMSIATLGAFAIREYPEAVGVMLFYRIGEFFEHKAVDRSRGQIMDAIDMRPEVVNLLAGEEVRVISAESAQVGDILLIRPGDRIPLDGVIVDGNSRLDTSPITGEPVPVAVSLGDEVTSGCVNTSGQLKIRVERPLEESMVTRILDSVENAAASKPKIDRFITKFAKVYTPCVVFMALAIAVIPSLISGNWNYWVYTALTFLVMSCPCALVLSVPLAFFSGIGAGSKKGILFKGGVAMESLSHLGAVVMDKTGTITEGNFKLQNVISTGSYSEEDLLRICAGCEQNSTHPIANSIVTAARQRGLQLDIPSALVEIAGHGISADMPEGKVLCGNRKLMEQYHIALKDFKTVSYGAEVFLAINGVFVGYLLISDTIKPDAKTAISRLKALGLHTVMLTGDSQSSAEAVARETGIDDVYAKLLPQDKLGSLTRVRQDHGAVMFVGDGINDAPVLAGADVGAAMGSGADAAIEAADAVFMNSSVEAIPDSIAIARSANRIAVQNVVFALAVKLAVMILGLAGFANMWMAVFADTGVAMICVLNSIRILYKK